MSQVKVIIFYAMIIFDLWSFFASERVEYSEHRPRFFPSLCDTVHICGLVFKNVSEHVFCTDVRENQIFCSSF